MFGRTCAVWVLLHICAGKQFAKKKYEGPNIAPLRLPPPHLRVSYFYPTFTGDSEGGAPLVPPWPNPQGVPGIFPPLTKAAQIDPNYMEELNSALNKHPFLINPNPK